MGFWVEKDGSGRSLYKLNITYPPSPSSKTIEEIVQFRLTPLEVGEYVVLCIYVYYSQTTMTI